MEHPLISIIILNFNGGKVTENCLGSVLKTRYPNFEIILVDNGSTPSERFRLEKRYGNKVKMIEVTENQGYAAGNNLGSQKANGKYLVFLNNDTIVNPNWLLNPIKKMESDSEIAFLQPKIKWLKHKNFFEYAGGAGGYLDRFGYPLVRGRVFGSIEEDIGQYDDEREIFWASGVALFCRKKVFGKLGGFDSFFFAYAEENDLCFRAHRAGYKVVYLPESTVFHLGGYTSNQNISKKVFLIFRNHLVLLLKNLKLSELIAILPIRILMDFGSAIYYLVQFRSPKSSLSILKAYGSLLINFPRIWKSRYQCPIKTFGYPSQKGLVYPGGIVWQYFVLGKKNWGEIFEGKKYSSKLIKIF